MDFVVENHGTIVTFTWINPKVKYWFEQWTEAMRYGNAFCVEHRYALDIYEALIGEGFIADIEGYKKYGVYDCD